MGSNIRKKDKVWILSIDGGGIRGLIPSMILQKLEEKLKVRIADIFDVVAGTSTGSIISLGLTVSGEADNSRPKFKASDLVDIYKKKGHEIFHHTFPIPIPFSNIFFTKYKADKFENLLKEKFQVCELKDIVKDKYVLVPSFNITTNKEVYFNNFPPESKLPKDDNPKKNNPIRYDPNVDYTHYSILDVIRASTAAPTYFPAKEISKNYYIDGGVFMNNPAYEAYIRAKEIFEAKEYVICSLGTGFFQGKLDQLVHGGEIYWLTPIISLMSNTSSELVESYFNNDDSNGKRDFSYYPIRPALNNNIPLDDTNPKSICELEKIANEITEEDESGKFTCKEFNNLYKKIESKVNSQHKSQN